MEEEMRVYVDPAQQIKDKVEAEQLPVQFDKKIQKLTEKTVEMVLKYGEEDYRSQLLIPFLDMAIEMKDAIEVITSINIAMSCMREAMECIDGAMKFDTLMQADMRAVNYGLFSRWKQRRNLRKTMRNNQGRMIAMVDRILGQQQMASDMVDALRNSSIRMRATMDKRNAKRAAKEAKKKNSGIVSAPSKATELIRQMIAEKGADPSAYTGSGSSAPTPAPKPAHGGVDDFSDILS